MRLCRFDRDRIGLVIGDQVHDVTEGEVGRGLVAAGVGVGGSEVGRGCNVICSGGEVGSGRLRIV